MKICHLTSVHPHTDTRIFIKECRSLAMAGYEVHLVAPGAPDSFVDGVNIHGVKKETGSRLKRMTKTVNRVYEKGLEIDADVYHFHDPELIPIGIKLKRKGKKVIYDIHEDVPRAIMSKHWINPIIRKFVSLSFEMFENNMAKRFDFLVTATPFITERFKSINPNTININNYPLLNELIDEQTKKNVNKNNSVCYVGCISDIRGINEVLEASKMVNGDIVFAGPVTHDYLKEKMNKLSNVYYLGVLNRSEVRDLFSRSRAGLVTFLPEPNHINAQPNKMFEYMSAGLPVICSDFPLWREIIEKNKCGICVNPRDPKEMAEAINFLLENPEEAQKMGENGRRAVEEKYNWETESNKLIQIYNNLLNH
ncbi:glycosyltransferase family 4 protein [Geobacillus stearothermophilus]|uniref:glycosyltransferase family 4 protein n=1 Tax=Geobacillus stearothermophilus TaxID=1422 RepID=UPI002E1E46DF|nr:glycosyltransferase family 4 protein [Geobacillus stearothermophilus]